MANGLLIKHFNTMTTTKKDKTQDCIQIMYSELDSRINNSTSDCNYLNLGYWENTNVTKIACEQMIDKVILYAEIKENQTLLDVGFGYGDQDIYIATKIPNLNIYGINISDIQVKKAQQQVEEKGLSDQIFLEKGDAISLNYKDNTFDTILAIESAFHFNTREKFLKEAYRTLKNTGTLCLTDCLPINKNKNPDFQKNSERYGIPMDNQYDITEYIKKLEKIGFNSISFLDISENVIPYSAAEINNKNGWRTESVVNLPKDKNTINDLIANFNESTTIESYYIIKAVK
jgi:microcystin synthetase protein McyJ